MGASADPKIHRALCSFTITPNRWLVQGMAHFLQSELVSPPDLDFWPRDLEMETCAARSINFPRLFDPYLQASYGIGGRTGGRAEIGQRITPSPSTVTIAFLLHLYTTPTRGKVGKFSSETKTMKTRRATFKEDIQAMGVTRRGARRVAGHRSRQKKLVAQCQEGTTRTKSK